MTLSSRLYLIVLVIISIFTFVSSVRAAEPSLLFSPSVLNVSGDSEIVATIILNTGGVEVSGTGARLIFDPSYLSAVRVEPSNLFADFPAAIIDNEKGTIVVSGIASSPTDLFTGEESFADIVFKSIRSGTSKVTFLFTPGSTTDSNIAVMTGNGDILSKVNDLTINAKTGSGEGSSTTATPKPAAALTLLKSQNSTIQKIASAIGLSKVADQYASVRPGRSAVPEPIDPMAPITRQAPITDPSTMQPVASTAHAAKSNSIPGYVVAFLVLTILALIGVVIWLVITRHKNPPQLPPTAPPTLVIPQVINTTSPMAP